MVGDVEPPKATLSLAFPLDVQDGWPPVAAECLPFRVSADGYTALAPPLFVKDLSVGDVITATLEPESNEVASWQHVTRSARTTIWLLRLRQSGDLELALAELRHLGCHTACLEQAGVYSVDLPESVAIAAADAILANLDPESIAVAFPSMRHEP